jgi:hypothetical protein
MHLWSSRLAAPAGGLRVLAYVPAPAVGGLPMAAKGSLFSLYVLPELDEQSIVVRHWAKALQQHAQSRDLFR